MKKSLILLAALMAVIVLGAVGYKLLTRNYPPPETPPAAQTTSEADATDTEAVSSEKAPAETTQTESVLLAEEADRTPDFTVYDADGNEIRLSDSFGKPIVVNFWATWCGPCRSELPDFNEAYGEYDGEVVFMMVNLTDGSRETVSGVRNFADKLGYVFPIYYDTESDAAKTYAVYSIPTTLFIRADGTLYKSHTGMMSGEVLGGYIDGLIGEN